MAGGITTERRHLHLAPPTPLIVFRVPRNGPRGGRAGSLAPHTLHMRHQYSYEVQRGWSLEFNDNYANQEVADLGALVRRDDMIFGLVRRE